MKTFTYKNATRIIQWGCDFDSLLELKFAISIRNDYEFLRSHIPVYYDPATKKPTNYIRENIRRYTPDFLIRHKKTGEAFLIEIKPRAFEGQDQLLLRKEVAENYIRWKNYDWKFRIIFSDEINLSAADIRLLNEYKKRLPLSDGKRAFQELNDKYDRARPRLFTSAPSARIIQFVMFGNQKHFKGGS